MRVAQIYYFLDVAQTQSITKSASNMFISPQGLSQAIATLEKECGVALFDRTKNGLALNAAGSTFKDYALELCESYEKFQRGVATLKVAPLSSGKERVNLYLPPLIIWSDCLEPMLEDLERMFPSLEFLISEKSLDEAVGPSGFVHTNENFIGLVNIPDFRMNDVLAADAYDIDCILDLPMVAKVHCTSPFSQKRFFSKQDLSMMPVACFNEPIIESIIVHLTKDYGEPNIVLRGSTNELLRFHKDAVLLSVALAINNKDMVVVPITDTVFVRIASVCPKPYREKNEAIIAAIRHFLLNRYPLYRMDASVSPRD